MSKVYWAFKNEQGDFHTITFEGPAIKVIDVKREILRQTHPNPENGRFSFGLVIQNAQTGQELPRDDEQIKRNTSLKIKRVPLKHNEIKKLQMPSTVKIFSKETSEDDPFGPQIYSATSASSVVDSEKARMLEMQDVLEKENTTRWDPKQRRRRPQGKVPPHYVCHNCGKPGHWKQHCTEPRRKFRHARAVPIEDPLVVKKDTSHPIVVVGGEQIKQNSGWALADILAQQLLPKKRK